MPYEFNAMKSIRKYWAVIISMFLRLFGFTMISVSNVSIDERVTMFLLGI